MPDPYRDARHAFDSGCCLTTMLTSHLSTATVGRVKLAARLDAHRGLLHSGHWILPPRRHHTPPRRHPPARRAVVGRHAALESALG